MESFSEVLLALSNNLDKIIAAFAAVGVAIDFTPFIKVQPVRFILRAIGNQINKSLKEDIAEVKSRLDKTEKVINAYILDVQQYEILAFANECIHSVKHTKEEFDHIIEVHNNYMNTINANNIENGKVKLAYQIIEKAYLECISNNSFLQKGEIKWQ